MHEISASGTKIEIPQTDPNYAPTVEVFDHLGYDELYRGVMLLKPEVLTAGRQAWQNSASGMADAVQQAHAQIRSAIADGWRGSAAALASETVQAFEALGQNLSDVMAEVGRRLGQANDAAETLRASVAQPVGASPDLEAALLDPKHATVNAEMQKSAESVRLDAVRVMNAVYTGAFIPTGNNVPGFPVGGMYPNSQAPVPNSDKTVPDGGSADVVTPGVVPAPTLQAAVQHEYSDHRHIAAQQTQRAAQPDTGRTASVAPMAPASSVTPVRPAAPAAPASTAVQTAAARVAPAAKVVTPQDEQPVTEEATPGVVTRTAGVSTTTSQSTDGKSKDKERQGDSSSDNASAGDTASGMGAGIVGGLAGGAVAFGGDIPRSGPSVPRAPKRSQDDEYEDEEYYPDFDGPTFLEPAEPDTELVGHLDPTTPPVVGEWVDDEE